MPLHLKYSDVSHLTKKNERKFIVHEVVTDKFLSTVSMEIFIIQYAPPTRAKEKKFTQTIKLNEMYLYSIVLN